MPKNITLTNSDRHTGSRNQSPVRGRLTLTDGTELVTWHADYNTAKQSIGMFSQMAAGRSAFRSLSVVLDPRANDTKTVTALGARINGGQMRVNVLAQALTKAEIIDEPIMTMNPRSRGIN